MRQFLSFLLLLAMSGAAQAHFIWIEPIQNDNGTTTIQVYFGEDASPDDPAYLSRVQGMKLHRVAGKDAPTALELRATMDDLSATLDDVDGRTLFIGQHDLGVLDRGDSKFRLQYYAKTGPAVTSPAWQRTETKDDLRLDVVPAYEDGRVTVTVRFDGEPVTDAEVKASGPGMDDFEGQTDEHGHATFKMAEAGLYSIRARHIEAVPGELDGKSYPETRHYSTVAVSIPEPLTPIAFEELAKIETPVTSFGAAVSGDSLYVYGGHSGGAHSYSNKEQGHQVLRLNLESRQWESLAEGLGLQGLALVAHGGKLYRIGGFTAKNADGEDHDLWSQDSVAQFDPQTKAWTELPPLPEPRSSFDAAVLGDSIYVIGGWSMQGEGNTVWHKTAWKLDLSKSSLEWQALPELPVTRRANAVAAHNGKLYSIGGMQEEGGPTRRVDVYDPQANTWTQGPEILGDDGMTGFGASAFATGGKLYVSTIKGTLQRLSDDGQSWDMVGKTPTPRFFHRMLPLDESHLLVVGGASMEIGKFDTVESLNVSNAAGESAAASASPTSSLARETMLAAHNARAVWNDFPGFTAELTISENGVQQTCTIQVSGDCRYELSLSEAERPAWLKSKLDSVISHRRPRKFDEVGYEIIPEPERTDGSLLVKKLDGSGVFRIQGSTITEVIRKSDKQWLEITNLTTETVGGRRYLPSVSSVTYRDPASGDVQSVRSNTFDWTRIGDFDLPLNALTVETGGGGERTVREVIFSNHQLTPSAARVSQSQ
ncbi:MAG: DUF3386 family protein [Planctomycetaceae bacterium]|nr:DUF3386 family protein [Planctomycetaceae bacterium]